MDLGVLVNLRSGRARREPGLVGRLEQWVPAERVRTTRGPDDIVPALTELRAAGADTLVLVGGDGTVGGTLTEVLRLWPADELPTISLALGGTINTIAGSLGARMDPDQHVRHLAAGDPLYRDSLRPLVVVESAEGERRAGMIFANGVAVRWLRLYYEESQPGVTGASALVARILTSASVGGKLARELFRRSRARVEVDGEPIPLERFTVMAAASVTHIGLGFRPFHTAGTDPKRFHFTVTEARAPRIALEMPAVRVGRVPRNTCLWHYPAERARLRFEAPEPWSVDADIFPDSRELTLTASAPLRFVAP